MEINKDQIIAGISKTGFLFENRIRLILERHGWGVINNRYYIDDSEGKEREIDILAYKTKYDSDEKIIYYTALIISCKKDVENYWSFLTYSNTENDPNFNYYPLHNISTDVRLKQMLKSNIDVVIKKIKSYDLVSDIFKINRRVSAFQMISKRNNTCQNDKRIYDSIITTIKATEAEKINVNSKKGENNVFYNFNLISLFEGDMLEIELDKEPNDVYELTDINYVNRHIINNKDNFYRVRFINHTVFEDKLCEYDKLCEINNIVFPDLIVDFYTDIFKYSERVKLFWKDFVKDVLWYLNWEIRIKSENISSRIDDLYFYINDDYLILSTSLSEYNEEDKVLEILNNPIGEHHVKLIEKFKKYFRYEGLYKFEISLPF